MLLIFTIALIVFVCNIPFGMWRKSVKKFSIQWFAAIHVPVIISIALRNYVGIELKLLVVLLFVSVFFLGQFFGKYLYVKLIEEKAEKPLDNNLEPEK